eukprot:587442-Amphidinium_carterae.1
MSWCIATIRTDFHVTILHGTGDIVRSIEYVVHLARDLKQSGPACFGVATNCSSVLLAPAIFVIFVLLPLLKTRILAAGFST